MDALIFMLIAAGASTLLMFVSGLYASSTNTQINTIYNYEYAGNALIALHYAKDSQGRWFWNELKYKGGDPYSVRDYLAGYAKSVWDNITYSSPAGKNTLLCFEGNIPTYCCGTLSGAFDCSVDIPPSDFFEKTVYTSSVKMSSATTSASGLDLTVILKLYY